MPTDQRSSPLNLGETAQPAVDKPTKHSIIVAVHGIGDQIGYETVQSVAGRVATFRGIAPSLPVGRFYPPVVADGAVARGEPVLMMNPPDPEALVGFGFAEVYWAGIARKPAKEGYVLEEAKKWARTITGRVSLRALAGGAPLPPREQTRLVTVLDEMVETIFVLERLTVIAEKAGLFKFSLRSLLVDFLGDVQLVADFAGFREKILAEFKQVMAHAARLGDGANDLFIVAHSEGTVVTFLGLLQALSAPDRENHQWIRSVKGLMTIGSPLEVHHILWPELWQDPATAGTLTPHKGLEGSIPWHNYYDYGDPIAYDLAETTAWLHHTGFARHLTPERHAFSRFHLPGKAHTDYWRDNHVFGHFIETVVDPVVPNLKRRFPAPIPNRRSAIISSYLVPHALVCLLLLAATYFLYRPVSKLLNESLPSTTVLRDVAGIGVLLLGITAAARIPRLTHQYRWWGIGALVLVLTMAFYSNVTSGPTRAALGIVFTGGETGPSLPTDATALTGAASSVPLDTAQRGIANRERAATRGTLWLATALTLLTAVFASWKPAWGVKVLPAFGALAAVALVVMLLRRSDIAHKEFWPVFLGAAGFFYLWWLATLLFDLVFVWHRYIRYSAVSVRLAELSRRGYQQTPTENIPAATLRATTLWKAALSNVKTAAPKLPKVGTRKSKEPKE